MMRTTRCVAFAARVAKFSARLIIIVILPHRKMGTVTISGRLCRKLVAVPFLRLVTPAEAAALSGLLVGVQKFVPTDTGLGENRAQSRRLNRRVGWHGEALRAA